MKKETKSIQPHRRKQYRELFSYLLFGVLTTAVNYGVFALFKALWGDRLILAVNLVAFVAATLFAYVTNKLFVFQSPSWKPELLLKEAALFFASRIFSFLLEEAGLYVCVNLFHVGAYRVWFTDGTMAAKIVLSFLAVLLNYFFSKFMVFRKGNGEEGKQ